MKKRNWKNALEEVFLYIIYFLRIILSWIVAGFLYVGKAIRRSPYYLLFPAVIVYSEVMLRIFTGTGTASTVPYLVVFGISGGTIITAIVLLLPKRITRRTTEILLGVIAAAYATECLVYNAFQFYMTPAALLSGSNDVATGFAGTMARTIFFGLPKVFVFVIPLLLYVFPGKKYFSARRLRPLTAVIMAAFAIAVGGVGILAATHGNNGEKYTSQFDFNMATKTFGLLTSDRLSLKYAVAGNPAADTFESAQEKDITEDQEAETSGSSAQSSNAITGSSEQNTNAITGSSSEKTESADQNAAADQERTTGDNVMDLDFTALANQESDDDYKELDNYAAGITPTNKNKYTGIFKGKNLILVCAEAFSNYVIDPQLTPTLYRMQHNGFYFSEYYQPAWGGSTITGEYSFLMGLIPTDAVDSWLDTKDNNNYFTMGNQLQRAGYWSAAYHNGTYDYYDRQDEVQNRGYAKWLGLGNGLEDLAGGMPSDEDTVNVILDECLDHQPFSVYYMTMDGHAAYKDESDWRVKKNLSRVTAVVGNAGEKYDQTTLNYLCYQLDLEDAMKTLLQRLTDAGIADDTVVCLTGDHYPYGLEKSTTWGNSKNYLADLYQLDYQHPWEKHTGAWLLWSGCLENEDKDLACEVAEPTYSLDILPTLSNLFGLEYDSRLLVGRDVFSDAEPLAIWNNYSWVSERGKYDSAEERYYPDEGYSDDQAYVDAINTKVQNSIRFSQKVVSTDYYGHLFGKDEVTEEPDGS